MRDFMRPSVYFRMVLMLGLTLVAIACERNEREQGGKTELSGHPAYSNEPQVSALSRVSHVVEVAPKTAGGPLDGAALFQTNCAACHQATGQGVPGAFPPLDGSAYVTSSNVERLASIMLYGLKGKLSVKGTTYDSIMVPPALNDDELAAVATYIRTSWSNKASGVEAAVFKKMREKWGQRTQFTIEELGLEPGA